MVYPRSHLRLVSSGPLYTTERWSFGVNLIGGVSAPDTVPPAVEAAVRALVNNAYFPTGSGVDSIKLNLIGPDGKYVDTANTVLLEPETPIVGTGTNRYPPQIAIAVTLNTAAKRGRASRGRFFLPIGGQVEADGQMSDNVATALAGMATTFLNALTDAVPGWRPGVASNLGNGTERFVSHVSVGRVYDTIRSRRAAIPEEYVLGTTLAGYTPELDGGFAGDGGEF
jgi:hypothetical protein